MTTTIYDEIPYPNPPFSLTQPSRLAVPAALFGRDPAPPERCRMLEIGCGDGGNLLPLAITWPEAEFVGFDLAAHVIGRGRAQAEALGVSNLRLEALDLMDAGDLGEFDYVVAHGLYAWVPSAVQEGLMALIGRVLGPRGVAFVSYNTLPGCRIRQTIRDMALVQLEGIREPRRRLAEAVKFLQALVETYDEEDPNQLAVRRQAERMLDRPPEVLFHDELGEVYAPALVRDVVAHAGRHGLQFLCEAEPIRMQPAVPNTPGARAMMGDAAGDVTAIEQLADILNLHSFRQSLFCRAEPPVERQLEVAAMDAMHVAADLRRESEGVYESARGATIRMSDPAGIRLLDAVAAAWPGTAPLAGVPAETQADVLTLYLRSVAELHGAPRTVRATAVERPRLWPLVRAQLDAGGSRFSTRMHGLFQVLDDEGRYLMSLLDGRRERREIAEAMAPKLGAPLDAVLGELPSQLDKLARAGVLAD